jgi:MinD-like ATPase involved in chromosome partitioning or flagellar assembly
MSQDRTVIAFTADRSGIGQTMALSSIALLLAAAGRRVLIVDWDFRKPSVPKYFSPFLASDSLEQNNGMIDIIWQYAAAARRNPSTLVNELQLSFTDIRPIECAIQNELGVQSGALHLLSAGREPKRSLRMHYFSWGAFFDSLGGEDFLKIIFEALRRRYDHILVDCPEPSQITKFPLLNADAIVPCFTYDIESIEAAVATVRWATKRVPSRMFSVYPLAMRITDAEKSLREEAIHASRRAFLRLEAATDIRWSEAILVRQVTIDRDRHRWSDDRPVRAVAVA